MLEGESRLCCWGPSPPPLQTPHLLKPLIPPVAAGEDMKPGIAGLRVGLPRHLAWFILDLLVVSGSLIFTRINLLALQQLSV